jgi:hypothetical protein
MMDGHETARDPSDPAAPRAPQRAFAARRLGIVTTILAIVGLGAAANTYRAYTAESCALGIGHAYQLLLNELGLVCVWPLAASLLASSLVRALRGRQWAWAAALLAAAAAGVVGSVGAPSAASRQVVGAVLGTSCDWWLWVTDYAVVVLASLVGLAYTVRHTPHTRHTPTA